MVRGHGHQTQETWHEHGERRVQAARTVERLRASCSAYGITRLARQTGLDRIGIPCYSAIRPAATMFQAGLADPRMKIEIEVTARRRGV